MIIEIIAMGRPALHGRHLAIILDLAYTPVMEKKNKVISFRVTTSQRKRLEEHLASTGQNKNKFFQKLVELILEPRRN